MKVAIASDHAAVDGKKIVCDILADVGVTVVDHGPTSEDSVDYPDFAAKVAGDVAEGRVERGILLCGTGIGMSMAANKFSGVRAALVHDVTTAKMSRLHNDANVLVLGGGILGPRLIAEIVPVWLETDFEGGRHSRRVEKIHALESSK